MTTRSSKPLAISLLVVILTTSLGVRAEPNSAEIETARGLYVEGLQLRDAGKLDVSLARFKAAHSLAATPITSLELGRAYALVMDLVEAREVLASVERMPVIPYESAKAASARTEARALAEQIRERTPALRIVFAHEPPSPPHVTIDGVPIVPDALGAPRRVNPGAHTIQAETSDGGRASATVTVAEREVRIVTLTLAGGTGIARVAPPVRTELPSPPPPETPGPSAWFYVGLGTAAVGLVTGALTGGVALSKAHGLESQCTGSQCPRSAEGDLSTSRTLGTVSTVAFAVAGAGAVLALVSWMMRPSAPAPVGVTPRALRFTW